jgi:hypothetical protein
MNWTEQSRKYVTLPVLAYINKYIFYISQPLIQKVDQVKQLNIFRSLCDRS